MKGIIVAAAMFFSTSGALGYSFAPDVPESIQKQMSGDLAFIDTVRSNKTSGLHNQIFGKVDGTNYTHFFQSRVTDIGLHTCGSAKAVACVIPILGSSKMWLTSNFTNFSHPQIARVMIVFHEARHTEAGNGHWSHAVCPRPFKDAAGNEITSKWTGATLSGEAACDITPYGSYGSSMIMLKNISKYCTNCTAKVKMDAGLYADDQYKRIIDPNSRNAIHNDLYVSSKWSNWPWFVW
jgi:hypothetical protein